MPDARIAFVDESGDPNLDTQKQGVTQLFVVVAVITDAEKGDDLRAQVNSMRQMHFGPGEMKSSGIGGNWKRRRQIIDDLLTLDFHFYALVVDKERIFKDSGLQYKRSFIKFLSGKLHRALFHAYPDLEVVADEHGSEEFMSGFKSYIDERHRPDLFYNAKFEFADSEDEVLVQLADVLAGTVRICARENSSEEERELMKSLDDHLIGLDQWPIRFYSRHLVGHASEEGDRIVRDQSVRGAQAYIDEHAATARPGSDEDLRVESLRYLLFRARFDDVNEYTSSHEIANHLGKRTQVSLSPQQFQRRIIPKLRDAGVLIGSSSNGYKLPEDMKDIDKFVSYQNGMIQPMLRRIEGYRDQLLLASEGKVDILDTPEHSSLRELVLRLRQPGG